MNENSPKTEVELILELTNEFQDESDRAAAVLAAAYLDHLLGELLFAAMVVEPKVIEELLFKNGSGPLGAFSARIDTAYCFGLLTREEQRDLHLIRKIRNDFAHKLSGLSFAGNQTIADRCRALQTADVGGSPESLRERFSKASVRLMVELMLRIRNQPNFENQDLKA